MLVWCAVRLRYRLPSNGSTTACTPCFGHTNEILMPWSVSNGSGEQSAPHSGQVLYSASGSGSNTSPPNPRCLEQYRTDRSGAFRCRTRLPSFGPRGIGDEDPLPSEEPVVSLANFVEHARDEDRDVGNVVDLTYARSLDLEWRPQLDCYIGAVAALMRLPVHF